MKIAFVTIVFAAIAALTITAAAQPPTAENLYDEGQAAYDKADYGTAIARWQAAYDLSNASGLLLNLAQAKRLSGDCVGAITTYKRFIEADPTVYQKPLAEEFVREL